MPKIRLLVFESCIVSPETTVVDLQRAEVDALGVDEARARAARTCRSSCRR